MKITKNGLKIPEDSDVADLTVFVGENMEIVDDLAGKMAPYDDSGIKEEIGDITDLATNTKTNLVGAINELADYDEFTVTDDTYEFTTSKRYVIMHSTATEPANSSFFLNGTEQGQIITIYNPYWNGGTSDLWVDCFTPGSSGQESVNIRIGDSHTFQYAGGNLWDLEACGARLIDYGVGSDYEKVEKPARRYYVEVPEGNTSTSLLQITNLSLERDKFYHVNAALNITGHNYGKIIFSGLSDIVGQYLRNGTAENIGGTYICNETDDVSVTLSLNMVPKGAFFNFDGTTLYYNHVYGDIMILIGTSTIETLKMDAWVGNEITSFGFYTLNTNAPFDPHSFIEITTV